ASGKLMPHMGGKLLPTCQTFLGPADDGMVVYTDSPKAVANQKAVMEYLLINHPLDCPVCDQAGECTLQDYSYEYGRGQSRFEETKVKQPKKDIGEHVVLYSDRCIMCTRCVRFTREVSGTGELLVTGRGNREEIDVFPGKPLAAELSGNVVDLCPVGALLDKDFLFAQRVWFLKSTPSIDGITASGDNISIEHNEGKVYRVKPRFNGSANKWWITDEVRYGWKFVHREDRLSQATRRQFGIKTGAPWPRAIAEAATALSAVESTGKRLALMVSPMLSCEDAYALAKAALAIDGNCVLAVGPIPVHGHDKVFPAGTKADDPKAFTMYAEKAPNARGVRRVLQAIVEAGGMGGSVATYEQLLAELRVSSIGGLIVTGNYPSEWVTTDLVEAIKGKTLVVIDTLPTALSDAADVVLPSATWAEKAGTFQSARNAVQAFEQAIPVREGARADAQIGLDLLAAVTGGAPTFYNAANLRAQMAAESPALADLAAAVQPATTVTELTADMAMVEL
ncbi:MAG TPA: molybdopterin-dependent oxidoreductase, partial [Phycisphaerales bacterium]|nr:molybdopterin-dependent oxidoreductase [Phycisphaerales bacterium]